MKNVRYASALSKKQSNIVCVSCSTPGVRTHARISPPPFLFHAVVQNQFGRLQYLTGPPVSYLCLLCFLSSTYRVSRSKMQATTAAPWWPSKTSWSSSSFVWWVQPYRAKRRGVQCCAFSGGNGRSIQPSSFDGSARSPPPQMSPCTGNLSEARGLSSCSNQEMLCNGRSACARLVS